MQNFHVMKTMKSFNNLNEVLPDFGLVKEGSHIFVLIDLLVEIATIGILHNDAESIRVC